MPPRPPGTIFVVDDDNDFRALARMLLERAGFSTREFAMGGSALAATAEERPAAVVLDVALPDLNGYEVCREIRDAYGDDVPILFVSGQRIEPADRAAGLIARADDYVVKPVDPGEFVARVRRLVERTSSNGAHPQRDGRLDSLTPREREILSLLTKGDDQNRIAQKLVISPRTVATHIQHILVKLGVASRTQAVALALRARDGSTSDGTG
jgi:DNA-binding NarL/FixJ family response regulator